MALFQGFCTSSVVRRRLQDSRKSTPCQNRKSAGPARASRSQVRLYTPFKRKLRSRSHAITSSARAWPPYNSTKEPARPVKIKQHCDPTPCYPALSSCYAFLYASRNSSRSICDCRKIVLSVEPFIVLWFGIVSGVRVPSAFSRIMAMWLPSLTSSNPNVWRALITGSRGASAGNFGITPSRQLPLRTPPRQVHLP